MLTIGSSPQSYVAPVPSSKFLSANAVSVQTSVGVVHGQASVSKNGVHAAIVSPTVEWARSVDRSDQIVSAADAGTCLISR